MKKIWLITDTHYNHKKLIEKGRPADFEHKLSIGCGVIEENDVLIHLGDVCIGLDEQMHDVYVKGIKGTKILVKGNHDNKSNTWYLEHGWDFVCESFVMKLFGKKVEFSHMPLPKRDGIDMNIHGHWHDNDHRKHESYHFYDDTYHKLLAIEYTNYKPVEITDKFIIRSK